MASINSHLGRILGYLELHPKKFFVRASLLIAAIGLLSPIPNMIAIMIFLQLALFTLLVIFLYRNKKTIVKSANDMQSQVNSLRMRVTWLSISFSLAMLGIALLIWNGSNK